MSYQDVKDKLYHGHRKIANNTYLTLYEDSKEITMRLYGNVVAIFNPKYIELYSAGWHTTTTKNRLNLALDLAGIQGYSVWQHDYQWYYGYLLTGELFKDGMKLSYSGNIITN